MSRPASSEADPPQAESDARAAGRKSLFGGVAKHSLIYGVGMLLARAVSFLMLPLYTRYLTPADYGVMALIGMTLDFISIIAGARLALGVFRFYHKEDDEDVRKEITSTAFLLICSLYLMIGTFVFLIAAPLATLLFGSDEHALLIRVAAANLSTSSLAIVPLALAQVKDLSTFFVKASVARLVLMVGFNVVFLVGLDMGVLGVFTAGLLSDAVVGSFLGVWLLRGSGVRWSSAWTGDLLRYGVPLMASQVGTFLATFSDRYFLQAAADEAAVGLYNLAYQFGFLLVMVGVSPMYTVWAPKRFKVAREENKDDLLSHGLLIMSVLMFATAVGISLYVGDVLRVMATPEFYPATQYVSVILIAYVFQSWANCLDIGILIKEKTKFLALANALSAIVAVAGYAIFVPRYLAWGAAGVTVVALFLRFALTYGFSQMLWPVKYRWAPVLVLTAWAGAVSIAGEALPPMDVLPSLTVRTGLVFVFFAGVWFLPILGDDDRRTARDFVNKSWTGLRARRGSA